MDLGPGPAFISAPPSRRGRPRLDLTADERAAQRQERNAANYQRRKKEREKEIALLALAKAAESGPLPPRSSTNAARGHSPYPSIRPVRAGQSQSSESLTQQAATFAAASHSSTAYQVSI